MAGNPTSPPGALFGTPQVSSGFTAPSLYPMARPLVLLCHPGRISSSLHRPSLLAILSHVRASRKLVFMFTSLQCHVHLFSIQGKPIGVLNGWISPLTETRRWSDATSRARRTSGTSETRETHTGREHSRFCRKSRSIEDLWPRIQLLSSHFQYCALNSHFGHVLNCERQKVRSNDIVSAAGERQCSWSPAGGTLRLSTAK